METSPLSVDFFVSYNSADLNWAMGLDTWLKETGYTTIIQEYDFIPGTNFVASMHEALLKATRLLMVLSPEYLSSSFATAEWTAAFTSDPSGHKRRLIGVRVRDFGNGGLLAPLVYIDLVGLTVDHAKEKFANGIKAAIRGRGKRAFSGQLPKTEKPMQGFRQRVSGRGNVVSGGDMHVAGDMHVNSKVKVVRPFAPDDRHITPAQGNVIRKLVVELAERTPDKEGKARYDRWYGLLYKEMGDINTYREILKVQFTQAVSWLKQQKAINRSKLRRRNPKLWENDVYKVIWSTARGLGWEKPKVYAYAFEKLALKKPITSLKQLGSNQLKHLAEAIRSKRS